MSQGHEAGRPPIGSMLVDALAQNWWLLLLRGVAAIGFGALALMSPGQTLVTLIYFYAAFVLIDGAIALGAAISGREPSARWWLAVVGLLGVATAVLTFMWPGMTALVLLYIIAGWAIAIGAAQIVGAIRLRKEIDNEWYLILSGAISVLFGLGVMLRPGAGAVALISVIGIYAIVAGALYVGLAFRLKKHG